jgi:hypothetical protein
MSDVGKIVIGFGISDSASPETLELQDYLSNKITHWLSQNGYGANNASSFYISPDISIDGEDIAEGGMKDIHVVTGTLHLKVIDRNENVVYSSIALPFRNSSTKRSTAVKNGISKLQYSQILPMLDEAKVKILKYYESHKDNIFAEASLMARNKNYDGAISCLMTIPTTLTSLYHEALGKANDIYDMKVKDYNDSIFTLAKSLLATHDANGALEVLSSYEVSSTGQDSEFQELTARAEALVTKAELEAAKERRQEYLDAKENQYHQWSVEEKEQDHRMNMDRQQMAYNRASLASHERLEANRLHTLRYIAANYYRNQRNR